MIITKDNYLNPTSKYMKASRVRTSFDTVAVLFLFALYIMPQYFVFVSPAFNLTSSRLMTVAIFLYFILDGNRMLDFAEVIRKEKVTYVLIPYIMVIFYTMVLRRDMNAFLNPFVEILEFFLFIYCIKSTLGIDRTVKLIIYFIYFLAILGIVEAVIKVSPFSIMVNTTGLYTGRYVRSGHYRIMSNCIHSLGYGELLVTAIPFSGYDVEKKEFNVFRRPILLVLLIINVFMTGSRSTLGIVMMEVVVMFVLSDLKFLRQNILILLGLAASFVVLMIGLMRTGMGRYIMLQLASLLDSVFWTEFSARFGADVLLLRQSAAYRDLLKKVFTVDWLNPILGIGRSRSFQTIIDGRKVKSIDSFYIAEYIRYAYPGMIAYIAFLLYMLVNNLKDAIKTRSSVIRVMLIAGLFYCVQMYVADSLMTLKYMYMVFAIYLCAEKEPYKKQETAGRYFASGKRKSKYVR